MNADPLCQMKLVSNSRSVALSRSNGRKIASTVNSSHDARVGRPRERMTSNSVARGSRVVVPRSSTIRGEPNRFVNVTVGSTLNSALVGGVVGSRAAVLEPKRHRGLPRPKR
jgi:hypothetical protein